MRTSTLAFGFMLCAIGAPGCGTRTVEYTQRGFPVERTYNLPYRETLVVLPDVPGVEVRRAGRRVGTTPVELSGPTGLVRVSELGFQRGRVTTKQPVLVVDELWGDDTDERRGQDRHGRTVTEPDGINVEVGEATTTVERRGPVVWQGGRTYAMDAEWMMLELAYPDGRVETVLITPSTEDQAFAAAVDAAVWNDERQRPAELHGVRVLNASDP